MDSKRWERVQHLFEAALAQDAESRITFIDAACGGDLGLRRGVASLVAAHHRSHELTALPSEWLGRFNIPRRRTR